MTYAVSKFPSMPMQASLFPGRCMEFPACEYCVYYLCMFDQNSEDGSSQLFLVLGGSGGSRITSAVAQGNYISVASYLLLL